MESRRSQRLHRQIRGKTRLSHAIYGTILMVAELGELYEHEVPAAEAAGLLALGGAALLVVHVYAGFLGTAASTDEPLSVRTLLEQVYEEAPVSISFVPTLIVFGMSAAGFLQLETAYGITLIASITGLGVLGAMSVVRQPLVVLRPVIGVLTALIGVVIVILEQRYG